MQCWSSALGCIAGQMEMADARAGYMNQRQHKLPMEARKRFWSLLIAVLYVVRSTYLNTSRWLLRWQTLLRCGEAAPINHGKTGVATRTVHTYTYVWLPASAAFQFPRELWP
jgi:hypothetical protein